jgi:hypothetical protein
MIYRLQYAGTVFPQGVEILWKYRPRGEPPFNVFDLGLRLSIPLGCQCREGWPGVLQNHRVYHRRGPIVHESRCARQEKNREAYSERCTGDAQDFHRHRIMAVRGKIHPLNLVFA